jgi:hypothetical protein
MTFNQHLFSLDSSDTCIWQCKQQRLEKADVVTLHEAKCITRSDSLLTGIAW